MMLNVALMKLRWRLQDAYRAFARWRQGLLDGALSALYERPVRILPATHVAVSGALVMWYMEGAHRRIITLRPTGHIALATLPQATNLHPATHSVADTLRDMLWTTFGPAFCNTLPLSKITSTSLIGTVMNRQNEAGGLDSERLVLVWALPLMPIQLELMTLPEGTDALAVDESVLLAPAATREVDHASREIYRAIARKLPRRKPLQTTPEPDRDDPDPTPDEALPGTPRVLH